MNLTAMDYAYYVIESENAHGRCVTNLRLQYLLYFIQAKAIIDCKTPCFTDIIEAWPCGPVIPNVYHNFKLHGEAAILSVCDDFGGQCQNQITPQAKELVDEVLSQGAKYTTPELVKITSLQDPWRNAFYYSTNKEITQESMKAFF